MTLLRLPNGAKSAPPEYGPPKFGTERGLIAMAQTPQELPLVTVNTCSQDISCIRIVHSAFTCKPGSCCATRTVFVHITAESVVENCILSLGICEKFRWGHRPAQGIPCPLRNIFAHDLIFSIGAIAA